MSIMARRFVVGCGLAILAGCASTRTVSVLEPYAEPLGTVPRIVFLPEVANFRDLGGWRSGDGLRVRQGLVYRSGCLNGRWRWYAPDSSREFLSESSRKYLVETLGIKTEIDLRKEINCRGMKHSALGPSVKFANISSKAYENMASEDGRKAFREVFKLFLDEGNYPIVFHCVGGNDRTGAVAYILNALLGVSREDLIRDWELSRIWNGLEHFTFENRLVHLEKVFDPYPGATLNDRVEAYVRSLGFSAADLARFRRIMLESAGEAKREEESCSSSSAVLPARSGSLVGGRELDDLACLKLGELFLVFAIEPGEFRRRGVGVARQAREVVSLFHLVGACARFGGCGRRCRRVRFARRLRGRGRRCLARCRS